MYRSFKILETNFVYLNSNKMSIVIQKFEKGTKNKAITTHRTIKENTKGKRIMLRTELVLPDIKAPTI